jgi:hypothetical protein
MTQASCRHHSWVGHPREAVKIDEQHIAVYSDKNILASLKTDTGAIGNLCILTSSSSLLTLVIFRVETSA